MKFKLNINYFECSEKDKYPMINISCNNSDSNLEFGYSNIRNMYKKSINSSGCGHGIQVNNLKVEKELVDMCDEIADVIYKFRDKLKEKELNVNVK